MLRKLVKLALIALYALVFGELFFRAMAPQPLMPRYVTDGGDGIRQNIAGAVYRQKTPEVNVEIRINQAGLRRDSELPHEKANGTTRIVLTPDGDVERPATAALLVVPLARHIEGRAIRR